MCPPTNTENNLKHRVAKRVHFAPLPVDTDATDKTRRRKSAPSKWYLLGVYVFSFLALYLGTNAKRFRSYWKEKQPGFMRMDSRRRFLLVDTKRNGRADKSRTKESVPSFRGKREGPKQQVKLEELMPEKQHQLKKKKASVQTQSSLLKLPKRNVLTSAAKKRDDFVAKLKKEKGEMQKPKTIKGGPIDIPSPPQEKTNPKGSKANSSRLQKDTKGVPKPSLSNTLGSSNSNDIKKPEHTNSVQKPPREEEKCTPWEISLDDWWQDHPTWEPSFENDTHACFRPIANPERVQVLLKAHALQFQGCQPNPAVRPLFPMGFAATLLFHLTSSFWSAYRENRQFLSGRVDEKFEWLYATHNKSSWAYCPTQDHECLFLPSSNCPRPVGSDIPNETPKKKYQFRDMENNQTLVEHNIWLSQYLMRPRQVLRKKLYEFMRDSKDMPRVPANQSCTWIHVRRADAMTEANYKRNYYLLKEYLTRGQVSKDDNLLLFTDDQSTIEEAELLHPEYRWNYWDRKRHRGPVPNNAHLPSGNAELEILTILAERKLASQCQKGVFGNSNMATLFRNAMAIEHGLQNLNLVAIDKRALRKTRIEPQDFVKELDQQLEAARKKLKQRKMVKK